MRYNLLSNLFFTCFSFSSRIIHVDSILEKSTPLLLAATARGALFALISDRASLAHCIALGPVGPSFLWWKWIWQMRSIDLFLNFQLPHWESCTLALGTENSNYDYFHKWIYRLMRKFLIFTAPHQVYSCHADSTVHLLESVICLSKRFSNRKQIRTTSFAKTWFVLGFYAEGRK